LVKNNHFYSPVRPSQSTIKMHVYTSELSTYDPGYFASSSRRLIVVVPALTIYRVVGRNDDTNSSGWGGATPPLLTDGDKEELRGDSTIEPYSWATSRGRLQLSETTLVLLGHC